MVCGDAIFGFRLIWQQNALLFHFKEMKVDDCAFTTTFFTTCDFHTFFFSLDRIRCKHFFIGLGLTTQQKQQRTDVETG